MTRLAQRLFLMASLWLLVACTHTGYRLVAVEEISALQACAVTADNHHRQMLEQQEEIKTGFDELLVQLEQSRQQVEDLTPKEPQCISVPAVESHPTQQLPIVIDEVTKQLVGAHEQIRFEDLGLSLKARMDTGINLSIFQVDSVQAFERNGEDWIRFTVPGDDALVFEEKLLRHSALPNQKDKKRPVIQLRFTLGTITQLADFALVDASATASPVRIGRTALRDLMVVDVSRDNLASVEEIAP